MAHLERFLDLAEEQGARFALELPEQCVPIRRGEIVGSLQGLVSDAGSPA
jgi:peptidoglycan-N-acetylglucosamine deacetylase